MAIYISKEAIGKNPFVSQEVEKEERKYAPLTSIILKNVTYLNNLMNTPKLVKYLSIANSNNDYTSVVRIKAALNVVHLFYQENKFNGNNYQIPSSFFNTGIQSAGVFDQNLHNAIVAFQSFVGITENGIITPETLHHIDVLIQDDDIVLNSSNDNLEVIGKISKKSINIVSLIKENENSRYEIEAGGKNYTFNLASGKDLQVSPIQTISGQGNVTTLSNSLREEIIAQNNITGTEKETLEAQEYISFLYLDQVRTFSLNEPIDSFDNTQLELDITPPQFLAESQARSYLVKDSDTIMSIIEQEYYNDESVVKPNPFSDNGENIFELPAQTLNKNKDTREHDAKLQFYLNLLYYVNTYEDEDLHEYGIKKNNNYTRYEDDHLDAYEMYDNIFDEANPETALPNYYRFLKYQESQNANSKINFDTESGETTTFLPDSGKYIYIPTREYADSLYYHLNFRHKEMLVETDSGYEYEDEEESTFITLASNITLKLAEWVGAIDEITNEVLEFLDTETITLLEETIKFFKAAYRFVEEVVTDLPRGFGGEIGKGIEGNFGFYAAEVNMQNTLYRKVTKEEELIIVLRQYNKGFAGLETAYGGSFGYKLGGGKSQKLTSGIQVGAGIKGGLEFALTTDYEFPMRQEETALLVLLIQLFGDFKVKLGATLIGTLSGINLDPLQYMTYVKVGGGFRANYWGAAQASIKDGEVVKENSINTKNNTISNPKDKSWFSLDKIWSILSGVGITGEAAMSLGVEFEYKQKFDNKPLMPEISGRMPSSGEIKTFFFITGELKTDSPVSSFLTRFLMSSKINAFLSFLNFETGIGLGVESKFTRTGKASDVTITDVDYLGDKENISILPSAGKVIFGQDKNITWEKQLVLSRFTGDVDTYFLPGSETTLKLNTFKLVNILRGNDGGGGGDDTTYFNFPSDANGVLIIDAVLNIIDSIELQFKPGIGNGRKKGRLGFVNAIKDEALNAGFKNGVRKDFVSRKPKGEFNVKGNSVVVDFYGGVYLKVEFKISNLTDLIAYYLKYWYLVLKQEVIQQEDVGGYVNSIKGFRDDFYENLGETQDTILAKEKYESLFKELNTYIQEQVYNEEQLTPASFKEAVLELFNISRFLLQYINNANIIINQSIEETAGAVARKWQTMDIDRFVNAMVSMAEVVECDLVFHGFLGVDVKPELSGAVVGKLKLAVMLRGGLAMVYSVIEGNKLIPLDDGDEEKGILKALGEVIGIDAATGGISKELKGLRKAIIGLPN